MHPLLAGSGLASCLEEKLGHLLSKTPSWVVKGILESGWRSHGWQWLKHRIAEVIASCLAPLCGLRAAYAIEMHGGEHVVGEVGDKDIDLILDCEKPVSIPELEKEAEKAVAKALSRLLGGDPYQVLRVPNIVELRGVNDYIGSRMLSSSYVRPLPVTPSTPQQERRERP